MEIAWDEASNITSVIDHIHKTTGGNRLFDALFGLDGLDRLQSATEGHLSGGSISGTPTRFEEWSLSQTGNWLERQVDLAGSTILTEDNTFNNANELKVRDTNQGTFTFAYNKVGQQTHDGAYDFVFDAWGRLRFVKRGEAEDVIVEHRYNGLGFRIAEQALDDEGDPGPWRYFAYDERWRIVAEFIEDTEYPESVYVHHAAGLDGHGGSSYIDSLILRDRSPGGEEVRDERRYYCQTGGWRSDVSVILTEDGSIVEWVKYTPYGEPIALAAGDSDGDGDWDANDQTRIEDFITSGGTYDVRLNPTLTGTVSGADITHANSITGSYQTLGRGVLSSEGVQNRFGYAGYRYDHHLAGAGRHLYHVRFRVYQAHIGRWATRDPLGYVDGMSLYEYVRSHAVAARDPFGLRSIPAACQVVPIPHGTDCVRNSQTLEDCIACCQAGGYTNRPCIRACEHAFGGGPVGPPPPPIRCGADSGTPMSDAECCEAGASCFDGDYGMVICCQGRTVSCYQRPEIPPNSPGRDVIVGCGFVHEDDHHDDVDCSTCPSGQICRPYYREGRFPRREECSAYMAQLECLRSRLAECGDDAQCILNIVVEIGRVCRRATDECGAAPPGCHW